MTWTYAFIETQTYNSFLLTYTGHRRAPGERKRSEPKIFAPGHWSWQVFTGVLKMVQRFLAVVSLTRVSRIPTAAGSFGLARMDLQVRGQRAAAAVTRGVTASAARGDKRRSSAPSAALLVLRIKLSHVFEHPRTVTVWFVPGLKHKTMVDFTFFGPIRCLRVALCIIFPSFHETSRKTPPGERQRLEQAVLGPPLWSRAEANDCERTLHLLSGTKDQQVNESGPLAANAAGSERHKTL